MKAPLELHLELLRLRRGEELLARLYKNQEMRTPTHFGIGTEGVAVGVCSALNLPHDAVFSHHRCHNHYLACGGSFEALAAELYGKETGCSRGRGGSVHLTARDKGFIASSAILGQMVAVATGAALAFKMRKEPRVAVVFFGEAACEEGVFWESMNYAAIHKLPVLYVCENNLYSTESPLSVRQPHGTDLCDKVWSFGIATARIDGNHVGNVQIATCNALKELKAGPAFMECTTYRWLEHVGPNYDHEMGRTYRSEEELRKWQERCPIKISEAPLLQHAVITREELDALDKSITLELEQAAERARAAPDPDPKTLLENVW